MRRFIGALSSAALLAALLTVATVPLVGAVTCTPTGFERDSINLTAAVINPSTTVSGEVDATGCNIGVYFGAGTGLIKDANIHGANYFGVVVNGAAVDVKDSSIHDIGETPFNGTQHGVGIAYVGPTTGTSSGKISDNKVWNYQKGGITANGTGVNVTISDNTVTGFGPVAFIAQNGIQVSRGASATVADNRVSANQYTPRTWASTGILLYEAGAVDVNDNRVTANDLGIWAQGTDGGVTIRHNDVSGSTWDGIGLYLATGGWITDNKSHDNGLTIVAPDTGPGIGLYSTTGATIRDNQLQNNGPDGIAVDSTSKGNLLKNNKSSNNPGFDCHDQSVGTGTAGTANTWTNNKGATANPLGICKKSSSDQNGGASDASTEHGRRQP